MKVKVKNISSCRRRINIEVSGDELGREFDRVYTDIQKVAGAPGFRPGKVPRDLVEVHYQKKAQEEIIKRTIPEYYLKAVQAEQLFPVAPPEVEDVQLKNRVLSFVVQVDVKPTLRIKGYRKIDLTMKRIKVESNQVERVLAQLCRSKAKKEGAPELNDHFAQEVGFSALEELRTAVEKDLLARAQTRVRADLERQLGEQLLKRCTLDVPQSLIARETKEVFNQISLNHLLRGERQAEVEAKSKELAAQARKEAERRVKLSFILAEIGQRENIQVSAEDLEQKIETIAQETAKDKDEVKRYLEDNDLIPGLKQEIKHAKTIDYLLTEAKIVEEK